MFYSLILHYMWN